MRLRWLALAAALLAAQIAVACPSPNAPYSVARPPAMADGLERLYIAARQFRGYVPVTALTTTSVTFEVPPLAYGEFFVLYYEKVTAFATELTILGTYTTCLNGDGGSGETGGNAGGNTGGNTGGNAGSGTSSGGSGSPTAPPGSTPIGATGATSLSQARDAFRAAQASRVSVRARSNEKAAPSGAPEILFSGTASEIAAARALIPDLGGVVLRERSLGGLGRSLLTVDMQGALSQDALRNRLAQAGISVTLATNALYGGASSSRAYANEMVGGDPWQGCTLPAGLKIGLIDGPLDLTAPALQDVPILTQSMLGRADSSGGTEHGTELAALIVGRATDKTPAGLARGARLYAASAFMRYNGRSVASLEHLVAALDWMLSRQVPLVNMSLAGPSNALLAEVVASVTGRGMVIVASTGNDGQRGVAFPAADPNVIAITAVDAAGRHFTKANRGPEVDFAAPGVDILVPKRRGGGFRSGTSYAAALATGIIAHEMARGTRSRAALIRALGTRATDLGPAGRDEAFGRGLIRLPACSN